MDGGSADSPAPAGVFPEGLNIVPPEQLDRVSSTSYDYIIVGGGAGGCPLAAALAEDPSLRILLLERGASRDKYPETRTQLGWFDLPNTSAVQLARYTSGGWYARGNVLSGGTGVNIGIWSRATPENIAEEGWDPDAIRSAYEHLEARLAHPAIPGAGQSKVQEAWEEVGLGPNNGATPEHLMGVKSIYRIWDSDRVRHPADELLVGLGNVDIVTEALVTKIRFAESDGAPRAVGLDFVAADGIPRRADVTPEGGEVILCAGTVGTPQLLILSGIGPAAALGTLGIVPRVSLPVGLNLGDNPLNGVGVQLRAHMEDDIMGSVAITKKHIHFVGAGQRWGSLLPQWGLAPLLPPAARARETLAAMVAGAHALPGDMQEQLDRGLILVFKLYRFKSRGSVTVTSADIGVDPTVDFAHFTHPDDVADQAEGLRAVKAVIDSKALASIKCAEVPDVYLKLAPELANLPPGLYPGALPLLPDLGNKSQVATWLKDNACTVWHMHGTCRVGEVVDPGHRVKGVGGLRIMDMSVFRNCPGTNPMATVMAVARALGLRMRRERKAR